jgi:transcriptional regulator with XRE-family HTH domain
MKLEDLIKKYREDNNISQREFARRCGLSNSLISIFEMGKNPQTGKTISPDLETYRKLANGMGTSIQKLFEVLGNDAMMKIGHDYSFSGDEFERYMTSTVPENLSDEDQQRLEALHQDPRLGLLFDRTRKMSHDDVEFMLQFADRILKERDGDE